jgi:hypothetical protein
MSDKYRNERDALAYLLNAGDHVGVMRLVEQLYNKIEVLESELEELSNGEVNP